jgi:hypothetical protein
VRCVNFSIVSAGTRYNVTIEGIPPEDIPAVINQLKIPKGSVSTSGSRIELPARSKANISGILDKLNVEKGAVNVPQ